MRNREKEEEKRKSEEKRRREAESKSKWEKEHLIKKQMSEKATQGVGPLRKLSFDILVAIMLYRALFYDMKSVYID